MGKRYEDEFIEDVGQQKGLQDSSTPPPDQDHILQEYECYDKLGYSFPVWRKWLIIFVIFWVQISMNFNAGVYPWAIPKIATHFGISQEAGLTSQMIFLVAYGFGCELWAPWSEEYGRWIVMQLSLLFANIWQILGGLAPNLGSVIVGRGLCGLSQAGGSVTFGVVGDLWEPSEHGFGVLVVVFASCLGSVFGPIFGGLMAQHLSWHWNFWIQLIFNFITQLMHFFLVPETRSTILVNREAKRRRKTGEDPFCHGPSEKHSFNLKELFITWSRPFYMFIREPIVLCCSLLSGFSDHLIFICNQAFGKIFGLWWHQDTYKGVVFITLVIGYTIGFILHGIDIYFQNKHMDQILTSPRGPERRLLLLLYLAPWLSLGLFGLAGTSLKHVHWIGAAIFSSVIGVANFSIYIATIDYMVAAYGPYASSATGGNGLARDVLSGAAAMYADPLYDNIGGKRLHLVWGSFLLACIAIPCIIPIYIFYWKGPWIRSKSKFANELAGDSEEVKPNGEGEVTRLDDKELGAGDSMSHFSAAGQV